MAGTLKTRQQVLLRSRSSHDWAPLWHTAASPGLQSQARHMLQKASFPTTERKLRDSLGTDQQKTQQRRSDCHAWPAWCRRYQAVPER